MISASSLKIHIYIAMLILALCFPREAKGSSDKKGKELFNVLVIQSYNQSLSAYSKFDKLLHEELEKEQIYSSIHTFYLDCERYNATDEEARMYSFLDTLTYIIHSGFISGYQNRYGDNLKPPTNVYHRMTA